METIVCFICQETTLKDFQEKIPFKDFESCDSAAELGNGSLKRLSSMIIVVCG